MKHIKMLALLVLLGISACAQDTDSNKVDLSNTQQKISYAIGNNIGKNFISQELDLSMDEFMQGIKDGIAGTSQMTEEEIATVLTNLQQELVAKQQAKLEKEGESNKTEGEEFLAANKSKEGVITTDSGLQYKVLKKGDGPKPTEEDQVTVHYRGYYINGDEFDSSYKRNQPATFPVTGVIPGWTEALLLMNVGDKLELFIPYNLGYGEQGKPPRIEPYKTLLFEVELIEIAK